VVAGGLMSYGADLAAQFRRTAAYVERTLEGARPGDLPIEQPTKFELMINMKTAKTLGLDDPAIGAGSAGPDHRVKPRRAPRLVSFQQGDAGARVGRGRARTRTIRP
jgi:ABC-type uncharacterized transport system substrate-binding protein